MGLLTSLYSILNRYTNQKDIVIGTPIAGRTTVDLENQIGLYVNTLAIRTQFDSNASFDDLFQKVKETTLEAYEHQIYPFNGNPYKLTKPAGSKYTDKLFDNGINPY